MSLIDQGRAAFERQVWGEAFRDLSAAGVEHGLGLEDSERLAVAAYLVGRSEESVEAWTRAHMESRGSVMSHGPLAARSGWRSVC